MKSEKWKFELHPEWMESNRGHLIHSPRHYYLTTQQGLLFKLVKFFNSLKKSILFGLYISFLYEV